MIPAPTTMTSACTGLSSPSAERQCYLHVQLLAEAVEIDLAWRATRLPAVLLCPAIDSFVGAEDLREGALLAGDLGEGDFAGRQALVAVALRNADLDRPVFLVVHGPVIEHERVAALSLSQLLERRDDERLELGNEDSLRATDVRLLRDLPGENVVHGLLLQDAFDVAENPAPFGELVGHTPRGARRSARGGTRGSRRAASRRGAAARSASPPAPARACSSGNPRPGRPTPVAGGPSPRTGGEPSARAATRRRTRRST